MDPCLLSKEVNDVCLHAHVQLATVIRLVRWISRVTRQRGSVRARTASQV